MICHLSALISNGGTKTHAVVSKDSVTHQYLADVER
jgi:hypothetical protein